MASLEGGIGWVATASGQAAEFLTVTALAGAGDHIVASAALYGGTIRSSTSPCAASVSTRRLSTARPRGVRGRDTTRDQADVHGDDRNPLGTIADIEVLSDVAKSESLPLVIDSTFATPYLCRPMEHGADIVLHSATKFLGGHGTSLGGIIVESGLFDWSSGRFPQMTEPVPSYNDLRWWDNFGEYAFCSKVRAEQLRDVGACLSPFNAFMLLMGIETLPMRRMPTSPTLEVWPSGSLPTTGSSGSTGPDCPTAPIASWPTSICRRDRAPSSPSA